MKRDIKNNKGITLVALILTIVISLLLIVSVSASIGQVGETNEYYKIKQDITALSKAVQSYYLKNGTLPLDLENAVNDLVFTQNIINNPTYSIDRNPNDNDVYYILYAGDEQYKSLSDYNMNKLPEVNIQSTKSRYVVNERSLTVYCVDGFKLDGKDHYTTTEDVSGKKFASEYYQKVDIADANNIKINLDTGINRYGNLYAHKASTITITIDIGDANFFKENGVKVPNVTFNNFKSPPDKQTFNINIANVDGSTSGAQTNINATDVIYDGTKCYINFDLSTVDTSTMTNRRKITIKYDKDKQFYYNEFNKLDTNYNIISNYLSNQSIEFEDTEDEVIIASEMNRSSTMASLIANLQSNSGWNDDNTTYANIVTAASGQKYVLGDTSHFEKAYGKEFTFSSDYATSLGTIKFSYTISGFINVSNTYEGTTKNFTIYAAEDSIIKINSVTATGHDKYTGTAADSYKMATNNDIKNIQLTAIQYTFTLASNTPGSTVTLNNTTHSNLVADGNTSTQTRNVKAYYNDIINYNVTKDYYRFYQTIANGNPCNEIGRTSNTKDYTMKDGNTTEIVNLAVNYNRSSSSFYSDTNVLELATKGTLFGKNPIKNASGTINHSAFNQVMEVELRVYTYHDVAGKDKINYTATFSGNGTKISNLSKSGWQPDGYLGDKLNTFTQYKGNTPSSINSGSVTIAQYHSYTTSCTNRTKTSIRIYYALK